MVRLENLWLFVIQLFMFCICYVEPVYMYAVWLLCWVQFCSWNFGHWGNLLYCLTQFVGSVTKTGKHGFLHDMVVFGNLFVMLEEQF